MKETRAECKEFSIDYEQFQINQIKHGRFDEKDMVIFPKFPMLNVLPYQYGFKSGAVNLFENRSRATTLVLNLINQPDSDCISYNKQWNPKDENPSLPFQITNIRGLIERYLGKRVFVNWPHFQYGIVCGISDFRHVYAWGNIPGGSNFYSEPIDMEENQDLKNYIQTPIYVSNYPFEISSVNNQNKKATWTTFNLNENETQMEYIKAMSINRFYENRQGVAIGPISVLLYVSPLIGYRTNCSSKSEKCHTNLCFSNQALAYPLQTTLFQLPNYKSYIDQIPQTINDYFKTNDPLFALQRPYYSSLGYVENVNRENQGHYSISCRMESSDVVNQPDIHRLAPKLSDHQLRYFTAQQIADQLQTIPCVISKITGKINVIGSNKPRGRAFPTNIGLSWKVNKPVKQVTKKMRILIYLNFNIV